MPLSSKRLKQFAGVTLVVTGLVALFANGEAAQMQAEVQAREARNELLANEAERLGTRKVAASMKVKSSMGGWGGETSGDSGGGEGSVDPDRSGAAPAIAQKTVLRPLNGPALPQNLPTAPGASVTVTGQVATDLIGPKGDAARAKERGKAGYMFRPDAKQIEEIKAASRDRTSSDGGGSSSDDDF